MLGWLVSSMLLKEPEDDCDDGTGCNHRRVEVRSNETDEAEMEVVAHPPLLSTLGDSGLLLAAAPKGTSQEVP